MKSRLGLEALKGHDVEAQGAALGNENDLSFKP